MGLTPHVQALVQHVTPWDHEFAAAIMEQNAARAIDTSTVMYVASRQAQNHPTVCNNLSTMMSDELYKLIGQGMCTITGDNRADEPVTSQKRLELNDSMFKICKPQYFHRELSFMESKLTHAQALFSIDVGLKKTLTQTVEEFNKVHDLSDMHGRWGVKKHALH